MPTPSIRKTTDRFPAPSRARGRVPFGVEALEPRFLLASSATDLSGPAYSQVSAVEPNAPRRIDLAPDPSPTYSFSGGEVASITSHLQAGNSVSAGGPQMDFHLPAEEADTVEFRLQPVPPSATFAVDIHVYSGTGQVVTSGILDVGTGAITIVGVPKGDLAARPAVIGVAFAPNPAAGTTALPTRHDFIMAVTITLNVTGDANPPSLPTSQPITSHRGWIVYLGQTPHPSLPTQTHLGSQGQSNLPNVPLVAAPEYRSGGPSPVGLVVLSSSTVPAGPLQAIESGSSLGPLPSQSGGYVGFLSQGARAALLTEPHRPAAVDLATRHLTDADTEGEQDDSTVGNAPLSWRGDSAGAPLLGPAPAVADHPDPAELTSGPARLAASLLGQEDEMDTRAVRYEGFEAASQLLASCSGRRGPSRAGRCAKPSALFTSRLTPCLAGLGGSTALFAGLLMPDLQVALRTDLEPHLRAARNAGRRRPR